MPGAVREQPGRTMCIALPGSSKERPWFWQERTALRLEDVHTTPDDPEVKKHKKYIWQVRGRVFGGVGHPQRAVKLKKGNPPP